MSDRSVNNEDISVSKKPNGVVHEQDVVLSRWGADEGRRRYIAHVNAGIDRLHYGCDNWTEIKQQVQSLEAWMKFEDDEHRVEWRETAQEMSCWIRLQREDIRGEKFCKEEAHKYELLVETLGCLLGQHEDNIVAMIVMDRAKTAHKEYTDRATEHADDVVGLQWEAIDFWKEREAHFRPPPPPLPVLPQV